MAKERKATPYFRSMVRRLKQFKKEKSRFPHKYEEYQGVNLGTWACTQRYLHRKGLLHPEQEKLLQDTGLLNGGVFHLFDRIQAVQEFYEKYGRYPFYDERVGGKPLGKWWSMIQKKIREYLLTDAELLQIQTQYPMIYLYARNKGLKTIENWAILLAEYQKETGNICPPAREKFRGVSLGQWCKKTRCLARKGELSEEVLKLLSPTGILEDL